MVSNGFYLGRGFELRFGFMARSSDISIVRIRNDSKPLGHVNYYLFLKGTWPRDWKSHSVDPSRSSMSDKIWPAITIAPLSPSISLLRAGDRSLMKIKYKSLITSCNKRNIDGALRGATRRHHPPPCPQNAVLNWQDYEEEEMVFACQLILRFV